MLPVSLLTAAFSKLLILSLTPTFSDADLPPLSVKRSKHPIRDLSVSDPHSSTHSPFHHPPIPLPLSVTKETHLLYRAESSTSCVDPTASPPRTPPSIIHLLCCIFDPLLAASRLPAKVLQSLQPCHPLPQPEYCLQLVPYLLILCTAKLSEGIVYTSSSLI